jgi:hypothetical protein
VRWRHDEEVECAIGSFEGEDAGPRVFVRKSGLDEDARHEAETTGLLGLLLLESQRILEPSGHGREPVGDFLKLQIANKMPRRHKSLGETGEEAGMSEAARSASLDE